MLDCLRAEHRYQVRNRALTPMRLVVHLAKLERIHATCDAACSVRNWAEFQLAVWGWNNAMQAPRRHRSRASCTATINIAAYRPATDVSMDHVLGSARCQQASPVQNSVFDFKWCLSLHGFCCRAGKYIEHAAKSLSSSLSGCATWCAEGPFMCLSHVAFQIKAPWLAFRQTSDRQTPCSQLVCSLVRLSESVCFHTARQLPWSLFQRGRWAATTPAVTSPPMAEAFRSVAIAKTTPHAAGPSHPSAR